MVEGKAHRVKRKRGREQRHVKSEKKGSRAERMVIYLVYFVVGTMPILFGAIRPWTWSIYSAIIFLAFFLHMWSSGQRQAAGLGKAGWLIVGFFVGWAIFQIVPVSNEIFEFLDLSRISVHQITNSLSLIFGTDLRLVDL